MPKPVDLAAHDPETRRFADRGAQELLGVPLDALAKHLVSVGETLDADDLDGLALAGRMAAELDSRESGGVSESQASAT